MKIKQQKQIKAFLIEEFGESKANTLFHSQEKTLDTLIENTKNKSENQMACIYGKNGISTGILLYLQPHFS